MKMRSWLSVLLALAVLSGCSLSPLPTQEATTTPVTATSVARPATMPVASTRLVPSRTATSSVATVTPMVSKAATSSPVGLGSPVLDSQIPAPPPRQLEDLRSRLSAANSTPVPEPSPVADNVGARGDFWVANQLTNFYFSMPARVVMVTPHTVWFVQEGVNVSATDVSSAAAYFESQIYPTEHRLFGSESPPGDTSPITILVGKIPGVGGYFSSADEYSRAVNPYSNERKMIYINVDAVQPGSTDFNHTVAHEFMHMIQFNVHRGQNSWINEGSAELAALAVTGIPSSTVSSFERSPQTQLNAWSGEPSLAIPHYGAAYLFMLYVAQHYGGYGTIGKLIAEPGRGVTAFTQLFSSLNPSTTFDAVFANWVAANVVDNFAVDGGRYGYQGMKVALAVRNGPALGQSVSGQAVQFGTTYYRIVVDRPAHLVFQGTPVVSRIGANPHSAPFEWWSNRGDSIDSRLTRTVDLSSVSTASLHFWAWYDIEEGYDYAYVETSLDGGKTWKTLPASSTTTANPSGQNYGNGFTGESGGSHASWVQETANLSPFVGRTILLRFEYVTDDSYNGDGLALDGISIPEIGWTDSASTDNGWQSEGFVRIDNRESQPYLLEVIDQNKTQVKEIMVDATGKAMVSLDPGATYVVAVAGLAPLTTQRSAYQLQVSAN